MSFIKQEWRLFSADASVWVALALFAALTLYATLNGQAYIEKQLSVKQTAEQRTRFLDSLKQAALKQERRLDSLKQPLSPPAWGVRNPYWANLRGAEYASMPMLPISALSIGQSDVQNREIQVQASARFSPYNDKPELENPLKLLAGRFDVAFVLIYLFPLLILALTFNLLSAERESGTLTLILSQPVSLGAILRRKIAVRATLLLGTAVALSTVAFFATGSASMNDGILRLCLWTLAVVAYGGFWFALALVVNAFGKNSASNGLALAACWLFFLVVAPSMLNAIASTIYPMPSRVGFINQSRQASRDAESRAAKRMEKFLYDHPELSKDTTAKDDFGIEAMLMLSDISGSLAPVQAEFQVQKANQQSFVNALQILSPAVVMQNALNSIAGTGAERHRLFLEQVEAFYSEWKAFFEPKILAREVFKDYDRVPRFSYREEPTGELAARTLWRLVLIAVPTCVLVWVGSQALRRYSVAS